MQLKDLSVGQRFRFVNGNGKTWEKKSNNGDITEYNYCLCIDDLRPEQKRGIMAVSSLEERRMNKDAEVVCVNN